MSEHIQSQQQGRVLLITMDRQPQLNALTHAMYDAMAEAIEQAQLDDAVRAVVLTGAGDAYTSGNDLEDFARPMPEGKPPVVRFLEAIRDAEKPLIAAVNGPAVGIGLTMLLHCDLSYAAESASFAAPFVHVGLVPEAGSSLLLPQVLGTAWANDVILAGRTLTAKEALHTGLVSRVFANDQLLTETMKIAEEVASLAPDAMRKSKALIRANRDLIKERMQTEGVEFAAQLQSPEFPASVKAFMGGAARNF